MQSRIYSGSLDSDIRVWKIPPPDHDPYGPFDPTSLVSTLSGHSNAVWAIALLDENRTLASASADGSVRIWDLERGECVKSWDYLGVEGGEGSKKKRPAPTALAAMEEGSKLAVAYQDSVVKVFEVATGKEVLKLQSDETYGAFGSFARARG